MEEAAHIVQLGAGSLGLSPEVQVRTDAKPYRQAWV